MTVGEIIGYGLFGLMFLWALGWVLLALWRPRDK
jgi:hypothetical protein